MQAEKNKQIIINAILCYPLLLIASMFLFVKNNPLLDNKLVKNHAKSATFLHLLLLINVIIFIYFKLLGNIDFFGIGANIIIANVIFAFLFLSMGIGIYKANKGESFGISESISIKNTQIISLQKDATDYKEEDKLTVLFSYIPFIGYIKTSKYDKNTQIHNNLSFNLLVTLTITLIYIIGGGNLASLLLLAYTIFIAFIGINIFLKNELINIQLPKYISPKHSVQQLQVYTKYIFAYLRGKFQSFESLQAKVITEVSEKRKTFAEEIKTAGVFYGPKAIIYIPIVNLVTLFQRNSKYKLHITNGIVLTVLFIIAIILILLGTFTPRILLLFIFPICFGIGNLYTPLYPMPYVYNLYELLCSTKNAFGKGRKTLKEKNAEVQEKTFTVGKSQSQKEIDINR